MDLIDLDACTLPTAERPFRAAEFDALFREAVTAVTQEGTSATLRLSGGPGLGGRVEDLVRRETECCSFFAFRTEGDGSDLTLRITVPEAYADVLAALTDRARAAIA